MLMQEFRKKNNCTSVPFFFHAGHGPACAGYRLLQVGPLRVGPTD